jgi:hypothetical protein
LSIPQVDLWAQSAAAGEVLRDARLRGELDGLREGPGIPFLVTRLHSLGLEPGGGNGHWEQQIEKVRREVVPTPLVLRRGDRQVTLTPGVDFVAATGRQRVHVGLDGARLLFSGTASPAPGSQQEARGRLLLVFAPPEGHGVDLVAASRRELERAAAVRAAGVLFIPAPGSRAATPAVPLLSPREAILAAQGTGVRYAAWLSDAAARALLLHMATASPQSLATLAVRPGFEPLRLEATASAILDVRVHRIRSRNVLAMRRGRDPASAEELVVFLAPLEIQGDAFEDGEESPQPLHSLSASAAAQLLGVAGAFQMLSDPPRRSVLFAFVAPGNDGGLGLRYLLGNTLSPAQRVVAAVLLSGPEPGGAATSITSVAHEVSPLASTLERAARAQGMGVDSRPRAIDDPFVGGALRVLAEHGIPAVVVGGAPAQSMAGHALVAFRAGLDLAEGSETPPRVSVEGWLAAVERAEREAASAASQPVEHRDRVARQEPPRTHRPDPPAPIPADRSTPPSTDSPGTPLQPVPLVPGGQELEPIPGQRPPAEEPPRPEPEAPPDPEDDPIPPPLPPPDPEPEPDPEEEPPPGGLV